MFVDLSRDSEFMQEELRIRTSVGEPPSRLVLSGRLRQSHPESLFDKAKFELPWTGLQGRMLSRGGGSIMNSIVFDFEEYLEDDVLAVDIRNILKWSGI